jgi:Transglutaminase-like superfamily
VRTFQPRWALARSTRRDRLSYPVRASLGLEILTTYAASRWQLRTETMEGIVARLREQSPPPEAPAGESLYDARRLGRAVARMLSYLPGDTRCLVRSLVLTRLLARRAMQGTLVIGVRAEPEFAAHAWVEHGGEPVLDPGEESYGKLVEL